MGIKLPTYKQSFNFSSVVLPEISLDEKSVTEPPTQLPAQLAQVDNQEPQLC